LIAEDSIFNPMVLLLDLSLFASPRLIPNFNLFGPSKWGGTWLAEIMILAGIDIFERDLFCLAPTRVDSCRAEISRQWGKGRLGECLVEMTADLTSVGGRLEEIITVAAVRIGLGGRSSSVRLAAA